MALRISTDPDAPPAGAPFKLCYDFAGTPAGLSSVTLSIVHDPPHADDPRQVTIARPASGKKACTACTSPAGSVSAIVQDLSGYSADLGVVFA